MRSKQRAVDVVARERLGAVDLTDELDRAVKDSGVAEGIVAVYCAHTTCSLVINEWEDGLLEDLRRRVEMLVPSAAYYAHDDLGRRTQNLSEGDEPANGAAHVLHVLVGSTSCVIPVTAGEACLGRWQRLFLFELDEPRPRRVLFQVLG